MVREFCHSIMGSKEDGRHCTGIGNKASLQEITKRPKQNSRTYSPGLVIVRSSSCRCCCKRKHIVSVLIRARVMLMQSRPGRTCKVGVQSHRSGQIVPN